MKLNRNIRKNDAKINIASLIDVVFLLIIFFMTVSHITTTEAIQLELPQAQQADDVQQDMETYLIVNINDEGSIFIEGKEYCGTEFEDLLLQFKARQKTDDTKITIRSDKNTKWNHVRETLEKCNSKGFANITVRVIETN